MHKKAGTKMQRNKSIRFSLGIFFIIIVGFSGCSTINLKIVHIPNFNEVTKVEVGENMYEKNYAYYDHDKDIQLLEPITINGLNINVDTNKSHTAELVSLENGEQAAYIAGYYLIDENQTGYFSKVFTQLIPGVRLNEAKLDKPTKYKIIQAKPSYYAGESFKYSALYQGKIGNIIKISFREFANDMARPAFTQDIEYELDAKGGAFVGFKGLRIEVIKATNIDIEYKVTQGYK